VSHVEYLRVFLKVYFVPRSLGLGSFVPVCFPCTAVVAGEQLCVKQPDWHCTHPSATPQQRRLRRAYSAGSIRALTCHRGRSSCFERRRAPCSSRPLSPSFFL